jgi:hypothetical protein
LNDGERLRVTHLATGEIVDVPEFQSEFEMASFWDSHSIENWETLEVLESLPDRLFGDAIEPPAKARPAEPERTLVQLWLPNETQERVKAAATEDDVSYHEELQRLVEERFGSGRRAS